MRDLATVTRDIDAAVDLLAKLRAEKAAILTARRQAIVKAFDDGASREQLCEAFNETYEAVNGILARAGRNERTRAAIGLSGSQCAQFDRLLRQGVPTRSARAIARVVAP